MANPNTSTQYNAYITANKVPTLMATSGTVGTNDTAGTAEPIRVGANPATGALYVQDLSGASGTTNVQIVGGTFNAGTVTIGGTQPVRLIDGTLTNLVSGTINALASGTLTGGTLQNLVSGTFNTGTVVNNGGTVANLATGTINALAAGTITGGTLTNLVSGTINALAAGTITGGTLTNLVSGTINALASGTISGGTLQNLATGTITALAVGTIGGKAASGAAAVANPVQVAGTDGGGTIYSPFITTGGILKVVDTAGTIAGGTLTNLISGTINALAAGTITAGTLTNLVSGTINALAAGTITGGTLGNLNNGTLALVTTVSNITTGSIIQTSGTLTSGTLTNLVSGTINALATGTITGGSIQTQGVGAVNAGVVGNPIWVAGADGATLRALLTNTSGNLLIQMTYPTFNYISAAGTTTIKSSAGILHRIVIGSLVGAGTLYNSAGTSTAIIWATSTPPVNSYEFNYAFGSLTWAGTGAENVTVIYS